MNKLIRQFAVKTTILQEIHVEYFVQKILEAASDANASAQAVLNDVSRSVTLDDRTVPLIMIECEAKISW